MARWVFKLVVILSMAAVACGCIGPVEPVVLETAGTVAEIDYSDLAAVLAGALDENGFVLPGELKKLSDRLDAQLRRMAIAGPTVTPKLLPSPADRLAYWYNARAAWALKLVALAGSPAKLTRRKLESRQVTLDGRTMTLDEIDAILSADADWRVAVLAPSLRKRRARLPKTPFGAADVRRRVGARFSEYVDDEDRFVIDIGRRRIRAHPVLYRLRERLVASHNRKYATEGATLTTVLIGLVTGSPRRRLQDAIGYSWAPFGPNGPLACNADD